MDLNKVIATWKNKSHDVKRNSLEANGDTESTISNTAGKDNSKDGTKNVSVQDTSNDQDIVKYESNAAHDKHQPNPGTNKDLRNTPMSLRLGYNQVIVNSDNNLLLPLLFNNYQPPDIPGIVAAVNLQTSRLFTNIDAQYSSISAMTLTNLGVVQRTWALLALKIAGVPVHNEPFCYIYVNEGSVDDEDIRFILASSYANTPLPNLPQYSADKGVLTNYILHDILSTIEYFVLDLRARITGDIFRLACYTSYQIAKGAGVSNPNIAVATHDIDYRLRPTVFQNIDSNSLVAEGEKIYKLIVSALPKIAIDQYITCNNNSTTGIRSYIRLSKPVIMCFHPTLVAHVDKIKSAKLQRASDFIYLAYMLGKLTPSKLDFQGLFIDNPITQGEILRRMWRSSLDRFVGKSVPGYSTEYGADFIVGTEDVAFIAQNQDSYYTDVTFSLDRVAGHIFANQYRMEFPNLPYHLDNDTFYHFDSAETRFALFQDREPCQWVSYLDIYSEPIETLALYGSRGDLARLLLSLNYHDYAHLFGHFGLLGEPVTALDWQVITMLLNSIAFVYISLASADAAMLIYARVNAELPEIAREIECKG